MTLSINNQLFVFLLNQYKLYFFLTLFITSQVAAEDALCGKGYELTMFVFTDIMVIAKVGLWLLILIE